MASIDEFSLKIYFKNRNIAKELTPHLISIQYEDGIESEADSISLTLEDVDDQWMSAWYPTKTDEISVAFGYAGGKLIKSGVMHIDTVSLNGYPSTIEIKCKSTVSSEALLTKNDKEFSGKTLKQIAEEMAKKHKLKLVGDIADIRFKYRRQNKQNDLAFLSQLAQEYGYIVAVKDKQLIFTSSEKLRQSASDLKINRQRCLSYSFSDTTSKVYAACEVRYWDAHKRQLYTHTEKVNGIKTKDTLILTERVESQAQAKERAKAALTSANCRQVTASLSLVGNPAYVAGAQAEISGFGVLDGVYTINKVSHSLSSSGWTASLDLERNKLKSDDPKEQSSKAGRSGSRGGGKGSSRKFDKISDTPWVWTKIEDDDGRPGLYCIAEFAARYERLRQLVHQRWPGRVFWVSCTTGGQHASSHHREGKAADCGVVGMTKAESYELEDLAHQCGFDTYNEYVYDSHYKTGDHMHIYIDI